MSACKWMADMLLAMFTVYLFFLYFGMFFESLLIKSQVLFEEI